MNGCDDIRDWLSAYLDGELNARRREAIEAHLAGCDACRRELASLRQVSACLQAWTAPEPAPDLSARFAERLAARTKRPDARWLAVPWLRAAAAAGLAAGLLLAVFILRPDEALHRPPSHPAPRHSTAIPTANVPDAAAKADTLGDAAKPAVRVTATRPPHPAAPAHPMAGPRPAPATGPGPAAHTVSAEAPAADPMLTAMNALNETAVVDGAMPADYYRPGDALERNGAMSEAGIAAETVLPIDVAYERHPELLAIVLLTEAP